MDRTISQEVLETTEGVARRIGVSSQTVRDWTRLGLPVRKLSAKVWRYSPSKVEAWLDAREALAAKGRDSR